MNVGKAIHAILTADSAVAGLVAGRVYPVRVPQNAAFPAVRYQIISIVPNDTKDGPSTEDRVRVQIDSIATKYDLAFQIDEAIRAAIDRARGAIDGVEIDGVQYATTVDGYDDDLNLFMRQSDFFFRVRR